MRHAEREDRAMEKEGKDWISTAPRPQDPVLSAKGRLQASSVGEQLKNAGVTKILCSPMIRTVISADLIAEQLGFGENSIHVEKGLVEESKSFRGKTAAEPRPNWNPLILPTSELKAYSNRINMDYTTIKEVNHIRDESKPNTVAEVHDTLTDRDEITRARCREAFQLFMKSDYLDGEVVLCVGHGATVLSYCRVLEEGLPDELKITGDRSVSCFAQFVPLDPANPTGPWRSVTGSWSSGDFGEGVSADLIEDQGFERGASKIVST